MRWRVEQQTDYMGRKVAPFSFQFKLYNFFSCTRRGFIFVSFMRCVSMQCSRTLWRSHCFYARYQQGSLDKPLDALHWRQWNWFAVQLQWYWQSTCLFSPICEMWTRLWRHIETGGTQLFHKMAEESWHGNRILSFILLGSFLYKMSVLGTWWAFLGLHVGSVQGFLDGRHKAKNLLEPHHDKPWSMHWPPSSRTLLM